MTKEEIIELRKKFIPYEKACLLQKQLIRIYKKEYKPKHKKSIYYDLILKHGVSEIEERHPQDNNYTDKVFKCFSVVSQHVRGYTKEHCLDQIYDEVQDKKKRIKEYKLLPTLEELVDSDITPESEKMYYTKETGSYEDSCQGHSGNIILEMRDTGIEEYRKKAFRQFMSQ